MRFAIFIALALLPAVAYCRRQRLAVRGTLTCKGRPYNNAQVKVVSKSITFDNTLGDVKTGSDGKFSIDGEADEITELNPQLKIYHSCGEEGSINPLKRICPRRWVFDIPTSYITAPGNSRPNVLDIGTFNLELKINDKEDRDCVKV